MPFALENLASSRALSALAQAQKRLRENDETKPAAAKKFKNNLEDPLDLSASSTTEDDVDVLSIDPPSPVNVEQWGVEKVVDFVAGVETCKEYAQVIFLFIYFGQRQWAEILLGAGLRPGQWAAK